MLAGRYVCWLGGMYAGWEVCMLAGRYVCMLAGRYVRMYAGWEVCMLAGRYVCMLAGRYVCWLGGMYAGWEVCMLAGRYVCMLAGRYVCMLAGRHVCMLAGRYSTTHRLFLSIPGLLVISARPTITDVSGGPSSCRWARWLDSSTLPVMLVMEEVRLLLFYVDLVVDGVGVAAHGSVIVVLHVLDLLLHRTPILVSRIHLCGGHSVPTSHKTQNTRCTALGTYVCTNAYENMHTHTYVHMHV